MARKKSDPLNFPYETMKLITPTPKQSKEKILTIEGYIYRQTCHDGSVDTYILTQCTRSELDDSRVTLCNQCTVVHNGKTYYVDDISAYYGSSQLKLHVSEEKVALVA